jgi:hypothetical protein
MIFSLLTDAAWATSPRTVLLVNPAPMFTPYREGSTRIGGAAAVPCHRRGLNGRAYAATYRE